jgi:hypothetical protein
MTQSSAENRRYPRRHPLNRGCGNETNHLEYWHLEHQTIFPRCQPVSRAGNGGYFPGPRDCWRLAKSGMTRGEVTREDHDHDFKIPV